MVLDQTGAPGEVEIRIHQEECAMHPAWVMEPPDPTGTARMDERLKREWDFADQIFCGSEFVRQSIGAVGGPLEKVFVVPYGVNLSSLSTREPRLTGPLRVLVVGRVSLMNGAA
ncbi:MAG: hypothetical protein ACRER2_00980 [Methylococcales bacterium]